MRLRTSSDSVDIEGVQGHKSNSFTRIVVREIDGLGGYGLSATASPYPMYLLEWEWRPTESYRSKEKFRELVTLPEEHTLAWLDDLVRYRENDRYFLTGIAKIEEIELSSYTIPEDYRKYVIGDGPRPEWYD